MKTSELAFNRVIQLLPKGATILDVGAGSGAHAKAFRANGYNVVTVDIAGEQDLVGDFLSHYRNGLPEYDCVWCSHVLEHTPNVQQFIRAMVDVCSLSGVVAITVPPMKNNLVGGHLNLFTPLSLIYNIVSAGVDCSSAELYHYGYNISAIFKPTVSREILNNTLGLVMDRGDIEKLAPYFPCDVWQGIDGFTYKEVVQK